MSTIHNEIGHEGVNDDQIKSETGTPESFGEPVWPSGKALGW